MSDAIFDANDGLNENVPTATLAIYRFIGEYLARGADTHVNRASAAPMCYRRRWYQRNGYPGEPLTPRKIVNFLLGDLTEKTLLFFIKEALVGPGKLYSEVDFGEEIGAFTFQGKQIRIYNQEDLVAKIGNIEVTAHVDGWGRRNSDGEWELIECKSAADYGFDQFKEFGPMDYLKQSTVNLQTDRAKALGANSVRYFYLKKNTGHIWDRLHFFDQDLARDVQAEYELSNAEQIPRAPHFPKPETFRGKPTGRIVAKFPCTYCPFLRECHGEFETEFKSNKPIYVFRKDNL